MSLLVGLCKADESLPGNRQELRDCVAVLEAEAAAHQQRVQAGDLDDDAFKALFTPKKK